MIVYNISVPTLPLRPDCVVMFVKMAITMKMIIFSIDNALILIVVMRILAKLRAKSCWYILFHGNVVMLPRPCIDWPLVPVAMVLTLLTQLVMMMILVLALYTLHPRLR